MGKLPLEGKRWVWILLALILVILVGVMVESVPSRDNVNEGAPPAVSQTS